MEDYNDCKMYIIFDDNWDCYIGHTIQTLKDRLIKHLSSGQTVSKMINPEIFPLEDYPCNNNLEARMREQCWMDTFPKAINKNRAYTTKEIAKENRKIYIIDNKEKVIKTNKLWRLNNKEAVKERDRLYRLKNKQTINFKTLIKKVLLKDKIDIIFTLG